MQLVYKYIYIYLLYLNLPQLITGDVLVDFEGLKAWEISGVQRVQQWQGHILRDY